MWQDRWLLTWPDLIVFTSPHASRGVMEVSWLERCLLPLTASYAMRKGCSRRVRKWEAADLQTSLRHRKPVEEERRGSAVSPQGSGLAGLDWVHRRLTGGWVQDDTSVLYRVHIVQYCVPLWFCLWGCSKKREFDRLAAARVVIPLLCVADRRTCDTVVSMRGSTPCWLWKSFEGNPSGSPRKSPQLFKLERGDDNIKSVLYFFRYGNFESQTGSRLAASWSMGF